MADTISVRVSHDTKQELNEFAKDEKLEQTSEAARKLLVLGLDQWHKKKALRLLTLGKVTLSKGAKLAHMNVWDFTDFVKQQKQPWVKEKKFVQKDFTTKI